MLWCCGVPWCVRGGSSNLEDEQRSLRPASSRPQRRAWIRAAPRVSPVSGQFRGCVRSGWERGREGQWAHFPDLVPGVGGPRDRPGGHFLSPSPILVGSDRG